MVSQKLQMSQFLSLLYTKNLLFGGFFPHWLPSHISLQHWLWWACEGRSAPSNKGETDMHIGGLPHQEYLAIKSSLIPA